MRFVGNDDDVAAVAQQRIGFIATGWAELLDGGEHDATGRTGQHLLKVLTVFRLLRRLA